MSAPGPKLLQLAPFLLAAVLAHAAPPAAPYSVSGTVMEPRVFAEGIISTEGDEIGGTFSPDGTEFYFSRLVQYTTLPRLGIIGVSRFREGKWTAPEALPFSGRYLDYPPRFSPDGKRLLFASSRPLPDGTRGRVRIWEVERTGAGWGEPRPLPPPVNAPDVVWNVDPSETADGTLYFTSDRGEGGSSHIYRSRHVDGKYTEPEKLGPAINSEFNEYQAWVSPDERVLVFASAGTEAPPYGHRPDTLTTGGRLYQRADLYISVRQNGEWTPAHHLEHGVNTFAEEGYPSLTPDGRYLFFTSERSPFTVPVAHRLTYDELEKDLHSIFNGHGNIFFIGVEALELPQ